MGAHAFCERYVKRRKLHFMSTMECLETFFTFYSRKINECFICFIFIFAVFFTLDHHHQSLRKFDQFTTKPNWMGGCKSVSDMLMIVTLVFWI